MIPSLTDGEDSNHSLISANKTSSVLYVSDSVDEWMQSPSLQHQGLLVMRPELCNQWDVQADVDEVFDSGRFGRTGNGFSKDVTNAELQELSQSLQDAAIELLAEAALPDKVSQQIHSDICSIGLVVGQMCTSASKLQIKVQILGDSVCSRWHQDNYVGRAIITYNSHATEYAADSNVDFWELEHCGNNQHIIRDTSKVQRVEVGDILFIKGKLFPGSNGLVHKSPEKRYHKDGRVINRLVLKIDARA